MMEALVSILWALLTVLGIVVCMSVTILVIGLTAMFIKDVREEMR